MPAPRPQPHGAPRVLGETLGYRSHRPDPRGGAQGMGRAPFPTPAPPTQASAGPGLRARAHHPHMGPVTSLSMATGIGEHSCVAAPGRTFPPARL